MPTTVPQPDFATVLGFPAESVTAFGTLLFAIVTLALAIATVFLLLVALKQLPILSSQLHALTDQVELTRRADEETAKRHIETNTLQACSRYTGDPVVHEAAKRVWHAANGGKDYRNNPKIDEHDLITTLNYLEGIALGVKMGVYSGAMVKDIMDTTFIKVVDRIVPEALGDFEGYTAIAELRNSWKPPPAATSYKGMAPLAGAPKV